MVHARPSIASGLHWIRTELDQSLERSRKLIDQYLDSPDELEPLQLAVVELQQVHGTAEMIQCLGVASLADEMKQCLQELVRGNVPETEGKEIYASLLGATVLLADYLDVLAAGGDDCLLVFAPLINELRLSRGAKVVTEAEILSAHLCNLVGVTVIPDAEERSARKAQAAARKYLPVFQTNLLAWLSGKDQAAALRRMSRITELLETMASEAQTYQVWRAFLATLECISKNGLPESLELKRLFGRVGQLIKVQGDQGEAAAVESAGNTAYLLAFFVGRASVRGPRAKALVETYSLDLYLPSESRLTELRSSMARPNTALLVKLADEIRADFAEIKDAIDMLVRAGAKAPADLSNVTQRLQRVSNTLSMLGLAPLRQIVDNQILHIGKFQAEPALASADDWMTAATAILRVEHSLDGALFHQLHNPTADRALEPLSEYSDETPHGADHRDSVDAALRELLVDLAKLKSRVDAHLKTGEASAMDGTADTLVAIRNTVRMLDRERAAELVDLIAAHTRTDSFQMLSSNPEQAERFALAVACVELYLEAWLRREPDFERILADLEVYVLALGPTPDETEQGQEPRPDTAEEADPPLVTSADAGTDTGAAAVDPEIRDIFLEEAAEVLGELRSLAGVLIQNPGSDAPLADIRRGFHTLKGSGRMVGAKDIAEFSWAVEKLLNVVMDGSRSAPAELPQLISDAVPQLRQLIEQFRVGKSGVDDEAVATMVQARQLASGERTSPDNELVDAFVLDGQGQLQVVADWLSAAADGGSTATTPEMLRAFHTLRGSAGIVSDERVRVLASEIEHFLEAAASMAMPLDPDGVRLVDDTHAQLTGWLGQRPYQPSQDLSEVESLRARIRVLSAALPEEARDAAANQDLRAVFALEALDLLQEAEAGIAAWSKHPEQDPARERVARGLQSLVAASASANCLPLNRVAAALMAHLLDTDEAPKRDATYFGELLQITEALHQMLDAYQSGAAIDDGTQLCTRIDALSPTAPTRVDARQAPESANGEIPEDPELLEIFRGEAEELLEELDRHFGAFERNAYAPAPGEIERALHTLKGSARMAGQTDIGDVCHELESLMQEMAQGRVSPGARAFARIHQAMDGLYRAVEDLKRGASPALQPLLSLLRADIGDWSADAVEIAPADVSDETPAAATEPEAGEYELTADDALTSLEEIQDSALNRQDRQPADAGGDQSSPVESAESSTTDPEAPVAEASPPHRAESDRDHEVVEALAVDDAEPTTDLAEDFRHEAVGMLEQIQGALQQWSAEPEDTAPLQEIQHLLHTLRGGASMAAAGAIGDAAEMMEARLKRIASGAEAANTESLDALRSDLQRLQALNGGDVDELGNAEAGSAEPDSSAAEHAMPADADTTAPAASNDAAPTQEPEPSPWGGDLNWRPEVEADALGTQRRETARVPVDTLDGLLNQAGEISIFRSRLEQQTTSLQFQLNEMQQTIVRLREQLRQMEAETEAQIEARGYGAADGIDAGQDRYGGDFDPLEMDRFSRMQELSRSLSESINDLSSLQTSMDEIVDESEVLQQHQGRINTAVQQGLMGTLMVPFSGQVQRLQRVVRQVADEYGKHALLEFSGVEAELDRNLLERMVAPLEHLLRNAVVHGLESPERRKSLGKSETGTIHVSLTREGTQLAIEVRDDGGGLDFPAIRAKAVERGLMKSGADIDDRSVAQFIFEPGFSTATELTQSAGRGVGMDVVASEVKQFGGTLDLGSEPGKGTRFVIRLPLSLAVSQALLVSVGGENYAVPLSSIEGIGRLPVADIGAHLADDSQTYEYGGQSYKLHYLGEFLELPMPEEFETRTVPTIMLKFGEGLGSSVKRVAVIVDSTIGNREVVTKAAGPQVSSVLGVSGATILADGRVVLILDIPALVQDQKRRALLAEAEGDAPVSLIDDREMIMVIDDSITMRRVAERLLNRNGYRVITARDGLDAIAQLHNEQPRAILLDIEMPRADGFEVATFVRNNERIADTPIIMITSRSGEKHRERAAQLGVNRYLIKPYQEDRLLSEVREVTGQGRAVVSDE